MQSTVEIGTLIIHTPEILGGRPHIRETRLSVQRVAAWYKKGLSAEEIVERIGTVSLAQVYAALAHYHANKLEIEAYLAEEKAAYQQASSDTKQPV